MDFLLKDLEISQAQLTRDLSVHIKRGHPWVFRDALSLKTQPRKTTLCKLNDKKGQFLAWGIYHPEGNLAFRVLDLDHPKAKLTDLQHFLKDRFQNAYSLRKNFAAQLTTGFRLLNGEGDGFPGLVCDIYDRYAVIKLDGNGLDQFWNISGIADFLIHEIQLKGVFYKSRDKGKNKVIKGDIPEDIVFLENGAKFSVNVSEGSKTGFFLDQRDNRLFIQSLAAQKNVLNVFSYTGGFSIYAGIGGAKAVTSVDIAAEAIKEGSNNWALNELDEKRHHGISQDAFEFADEAIKKKMLFDLVIVDPPSFAPSAQTLKAGLEAYQKIFTKALKLTSPTGIVAFSSCSSHVDFPTFLDLCQIALSKSQRRGQVLRISGQGLDHPYPLAAMELRYLKFVVMRVF